jgi:hypothetical protein
MNSYASAFIIEAALGIVDEQTSRAPFARLLVENDVSAMLLANRAVAIVLQYLKVWLSLI